LVSLYRVRGTGHWEALALFRALGRSPFNCLDVAKIRLFHEEIGRLWDRQAPRLTPLRPRLEEILRALMVGLSEKEIAADLGLSQHTVHDYIKALHKTYRVRSRGELLAAAAGRLPGDSMIAPANDIATGIVRPNRDVTLDSSSRMARKT
jgi:DNA-binding CsgD family transcriptional regulator